MNLNENLHRMAKKEPNTLWAAFKSGKEEAFSQLFFEYYEMLYHYGYRITSNEALVKDTLQDFFLHLFESRSKLTNSVDNIAAYLLTSFRRMLIRKLQRQQKKEYAIHKISPDDSFPFELGIEDVIIKKEAGEISKRLVNQLLEELPPRQREIIYLKYYLDLSLPEIASTLSISYQVAANHLYRAINKLRESTTIKKSFLDIWFFLLLYSLLGC